MPDAAPLQPRSATVRQLAYRIKGAGSTPAPRFSVLLGAGASVESGIPLASAMMADFCQRIIQEQCPEEITDPQEQKDWLEKQSWYVASKGRGSLYSDLFEMHEQKERGRQLYVETMIEGKQPSFGYVVLANLMAQNYLNTILTTNFDDLVYNACSTFTDIRPAVYSYGSMVSDLRITNARPKILKLHGDYLYSKLKNSVSELAHQDPNMSRYVSILLKEYGLVVIGYSGCDASVMTLLRELPSDNYLYWCSRAGSPLPESVRTLLLETDGYLVEIESFDRLMDEIRSIVGFDVPKMLGSLDARQDHIIEQLKTFPRSLSSLASLLREISHFRRQGAPERSQEIQKEEALLHYADAREAWSYSDFAKAEAEFRASIALNPDDVNARLDLAGVFSQIGKYQQSEEELKKLRTTVPAERVVDVAFQLGYVYMLQGRFAESLAEYLDVIRLSPQDAWAYNAAGVDYLHLNRLDEAAAILKKASELNPLIYYPPFNLATVLALQGNVADSQKQWLMAESLWNLNDHIDPYNKAIIQASLGKTDEAVVQMREAIAEGQPGLASLALESVVRLTSAPTSSPVIEVLRKMLEAAIPGNSTAVPSVSASSS